MKHTQHNLEDALNQFLYGFGEISFNKLCFEATNTYPKFYLRRWGFTQAQMILIYRHIDEFTSYYDELPVDEYENSDDF